MIDSEFGRLLSTLQADVKALRSESIHQAKEITKMSVQNENISELLKEAITTIKLRDENFDNFKYDVSKTLESLRMEQAEIRYKSELFEQNNKKNWSLVKAAVGIAVAAVTTAIGSILTNIFGG